MFMRGSAQVNPHKTHSESTEWGEIRFRKNDMKYRYDWAEIKHASDLWCYQLSRMDEVFQGDNPVIDSNDIRYIREVMDRNPKLERLMPCLIEQTMLLYWQQDESEQLELFD